MKVLLTDTNRWALSSRLAMSFAEAGCEVAALCPAPGHALSRTHAVRQLFRYRGLSPLGSLRAAIAAAQPDLILPVCDRSVEHLHELHARALVAGEAGRPLAVLIERSLGPASSFPVVTSRYGLLAVAREEGIRVPAMKPLRAPGDLEDWGAYAPFPWVVKADGTWGGTGVRIVDSLHEARQAARQLAHKHPLSRAIKRLAVNRDSFWFRPWWNHRSRPVVVQAYIPGRPANCAVACWRGRVLAMICVEVVASEGLTGPAWMVRIVENHDMAFAATRLAARLQLTGLFGLDFVLDDATRAAWLVEMNPRATPPSHLRLGRDMDLPGSLCAELTGQPLPQREPATQEKTIVYFPNAVSIDQPNGIPCYRDIPRGEPDLVRELLAPFPDRTLLYRIVHRMTQSRRSEPPLPHSQTADGNVLPVGRS